MTDKQVVPEAVSDEAVMADQAVRELIRKTLGELASVGAGIVTMNQSLDAIRSDVTSMRSDITTMKADITSMNRDVKTLQRNVEDLSERADRQEKRLAAIETFPPFPMSQPPRYLATEAHSVSMAQRVRLSHLG